MRTILCKCDICGSEHSVEWGFEMSLNFSLPISDIPVAIRVMPMQNPVEAFGKEFLNKQWCDNCFNKFSSTLNQGIQEAVNKAVAAVLSPVKFDKELEDILNEEV